MLFQAFQLPDFYDKNNKNTVEKQSILFFHNKSKHKISCITFWRYVFIKAYNIFLHFNLIFKKIVHHCIYNIAFNIGQELIIKKISSCPIKTIGKVVSISTLVWSTFSVGQFQLIRHMRGRGVVPRRLFFGAQQRIAITWRPKYYKKKRCFITRKNQKEYGPDVK